MAESQAIRAQAGPRLPNWAAPMGAGLRAVTPRQAAGLAGLGALCLIAAVYGLTIPLNIDEHQYISAAFLLGEHRIYNEFFHSQTPYLPIALSWVMALTGETSPYLVGRAFNAFWTIITLIALYVALARLTRAPIFTLILLAGAVATPIMDLAMKAVRNDMMSLASLSIAAALFIEAYGAPERRCRRLAFGAGIALAIAVGAKLSYAVMPLVFVGFAVLYPDGRAFRARVLALVAPLCLGGAVGGAPLVYYAATSPTFLQQTVEFHKTAHANWWNENGCAASAGPEMRADDPGWGKALKRMLAPCNLRGQHYYFSPSGRIGRLASYFYTGPVLAFTLALGGMWALSLLPGGLTPRWAGVREQAAGALSLAGLAAGAPFLLQAKPLHTQYLVILIPFVLIASAVWASGLTRALAGRFGERTAQALRIGAIAGFVALIFATDAIAPKRKDSYNGIILTFARLMGEDQFFITSHTRPVARAFEAALGPADRSLKVASLMPLYAIDAGYGVYREFANAPFFYRTNDTYDAETLAALNGASPARLYDWLTDNDVKAIFAGYHPRIEAPFYRYAEERGFRRINIPLPGGHSFFPEDNVGVLLVSPEIGRETGPD